MEEKMTKLGEEAKKFTNQVGSAVQNIQWPKPNACALKGNGGTVKKVLNVIGNLLNLVGNIGGIVAGGKAIQYAKVIRRMEVGEYVSDLAYGGDAYTGIQNAGAATACNVQDLARLVRSGFSALLTVIGIALIFFFISRIHWKFCNAAGEKGKKPESEEAPKEVEAPAEEAPVEEETPAVEEAVEEPSETEE